MVCVPHAPRRRVARIALSGANKGDRAFLCRRPSWLGGSSLVEMSDAPCQGDEGAPPAWLVFANQVSVAAGDLQVGEEIVVITWLDRARRDVVRTYPEDDKSAGLFGVFSTRSPDRPNPIGLHRVRILARDGLRVQVSPLEALDGTPIVDVKPVLDPVQER